MLIVLAVVLVWSVLAFISRTILSSTTHTFSHVGQTGEIERNLLVSASREGKVNRVECHREKSNVWKCQLHFDDGRLLSERVTWYKSQHSFGVSLIGRTPKGNQPG